jgi:hypothetical protein
MCVQFQGKHIRVDMATAPRKDSKPDVDNASEYDRTRSLFVGNVPFDVEVLPRPPVFGCDKPGYDMHKEVNEDQQCF